MFLDDKFLLSSKSAQELFFTAKQMPIIDYHCHLNPQEIYENKNFVSITDIWLGGDHYKWRLMRANGIDEELITGNADAWDKFYAWASTIEKAIGNPLYEWSHLELKRFFGIDTVLSRATAKEIYSQCNQLLKRPEFSPRELIVKMKVQKVCTTDDPIDDLQYHKLLQDSEDRFAVLPTFRPDKIIALNLDYYKQLGTINNFSDLEFAIEEKIKYFIAHGCKLSDHGFVELPLINEPLSNPDAILKKALSGKNLNKAELDQFQFTVLQTLIKLYKKYNIIMQWHFGALRNVNDVAFQTIGPDTGFDAIYDGKVADALQQLLDAAYKSNSLPTCIFYSLNPNDWLAILTIMGGFNGLQNADGTQKMYLGSGWWFNDTESGMRQQLTALAEQSLLGNFIGMLTDSRSFLSYPRHEYFRRVLCSLLGEWVARGKIPLDDNLQQVVQDIAYNNIKKLLDSIVE